MRETVLEILHEIYGEENIVRKTVHTCEAIQWRVKPLNRTGQSCRTYLGRIDDGTDFREMFQKSLSGSKNKLNIYEGKNLEIN